MITRFLHLPKESGLNLRDQVCGVIANGITEGKLLHGQRLPSVRALSRHLEISRNTVFAAYSRLVDLDLIIVRNRSGYFIQNPTSVEDERQPSVQDQHSEVTNAHSWFRSFDELPSAMRYVEQPADWSSYPYPFIYNQIDANIFPLEGWRDCMRTALSKQNVSGWTGESVGSDDQDLSEHLRRRLLNARGIQASSDEILITSGAQNALYILATLFGGRGRTVGVENPGYPDARNAFKLTGSTLARVPVDHLGLTVSKIPNECSLVYCTASHQFPTTVTMPLKRRLALLERANRENFVVVEDDYEAEMNYVKDPSPSLKSLDETGRVIYVGSLSKSVSPGLRLGFMVGDRAIIKEARAVRNAMLRHPPTVLQRTAGLFFQLGYYDAHIRRLHRRYKARWKEMADALDAHLPSLFRSQSSGGTCFWLKGPNKLKSGVLAERLKARGVLIDAGAPFFTNSSRGDAFFRLGFASMPVAKINTGIEIISEEIARF